MCSIDDLPYDILTEVLSYLSVTDILRSAQHVDWKWKEACNYIQATWRRKLYQPGNGLDNSVIIEEVERIPKLQGLLLEHDFTNNFFGRVMSKCRFLNTLIVTACEVDHVMMQTLSTNCPNIKHLQMPISTSYKLTLQEVARLENLKTLVLMALFGFYDNVDVKPLADGCPSLERISFESFCILKKDLVYFLDKKGDMLRQLTFEAEVVGDVGRECAVPLLSRCKMLNMLNIECYCGNMEAPSELAMQQTLNLQNLNTVTSLTLILPIRRSYAPRMYIPVPTMVLNLFRGHCLSQLVFLTLFLFHDEAKQLVDSVAKNCPLLKRLYLVWPTGTSVTYDCLRNLPSLPLLEYFTFQYNTFENNYIDYLSCCRSLLYLNLTGCKFLGKGTMKKIVTLSNLKELILDKCDVQHFPFHQVSDQMKNLTYISLYESKYVDWKGVKKLKQKSSGLTIEREPPFRYARCSPMIGKFPRT